MRRVMFGLFALVCVGSVAVQAQTTGKIQGVVRDGATQRPIRNSAVLILGTSLQARTNAEGAYLIDSIPAGTVAVRAIYPGYKPREVAGARVLAGQTMVQDFMLDAAPITLREVVITPGLLLRFQLIRPIATRTRDKAIMPIDSALRDLFQWQGYQLLSQAAITTDMPTPPQWGGNTATAYTQTMLNVEGNAYELSVRIDTVTPPQVKMTVSLTGLGRAGSVAGRPPVATERKAMLSTTVTVSFGRTVVLGSTQPGSGRGGMTGTLILAVRPELQRVLGSDNVVKKSPEP
jgi:hypothetical protein